MHTILDELSRRWRSLFSALARGEDVPPAQALRTEGMMEAAVLQQLATADELTASMAACYRQVHGRALEEDLGADWLDFYPHPQIPLQACRAPVYPSTPD